MNLFFFLDLNGLFRLPDLPLVGREELFSLFLNLFILLFLLFCQYFCTIF